MQWKQLPPDLPEPLRDFKLALRRTINNAGYPTLRALAEKTGISVSTLSDAAGGSGIPEWENFEAIRSACGSRAPADSRYTSWTGLYRQAHAAARGPAPAAPKPRPAPGPAVPAALAELVSRAAAAHETPDGGHAERLTGIMRRLLEPTPVESALLQLAAHHHGLGDRLGGYLHRLPPDLLTFGGVPLLEPLLALCAAVSRPTVELRGPAYDAVPGLDADLRLCAIVLRTAELLDVTSARPPAVVRAHIGLPAAARPPTGAANIGELGFPAERTPGYAVTLHARPDHPSAEHDLREYLTAANAELLQCQAIRLDPRPRRQPPALPAEISCDRIYPAGYKYGEFRFELDRGALLDLFMGEELYDDPLVFLRELLQNAFDAVRLRHYLHGAEPAHRVALTCWQDETGYLWIRVDDPGIGMDEHTLGAYFLRIGRSYYRSAECAAEIVRRGRDLAGFTPISRFGIGVLACFMVADQVEVSTRRLYPDGTAGTPLRLSLSRDADYFVLREAGMPAGPMPARKPGEQEEYRSGCGTSIALRIDPMRADVSPAAVAATVDRFLFCPPVPVTLNDEPVGRITNDLVDRPWVNGVRVVEVPVEARRRSEDGLQQGWLPYGGPLHVAVIPLDLTRHSATPLLRGQMIACRAFTGPEASDLLVGLRLEDDEQLAEAAHLLRSAVTGVDFSVSWSERTHLNISIFRTLNPEIVERVIEMLEPGLLDRVTPELRQSRGARRRRPDNAGFVVSRSALVDALITGYTPHSGEPLYQTSSYVHVGWETLRDASSPQTLPKPAPWLGHNGIAVPGLLAEQAREHLDQYHLEFNRLFGRAICGLVALGDALRPDVSVARNQLRHVPFAVHSALQLAVRRAVAPLVAGPFTDVAEALLEMDLIPVPPAGRFTVAALADPLVDGGAWDTEEILHGDPYRTSVVQLRGRSGHVMTDYYAVGSWLDETNDHPQWFQFHEVMRNLLLHTRLGTAAGIAMVESRYLDEPPYPEDRLVVVAAAPGHPPGAGHFPPLVVLPFLDGPERLRGEHGPWNLRHPAIAWIVEHAGILTTELPVAHERIRAALAAPARYQLHPALPIDPEEEIAETLALIRRIRPDLGAPEL